MSATQFVGVRPPRFSIRERLRRENLLLVAKNAIRSSRGSVTVDQLWTYKFHDQIRISYQQVQTKVVGLIDPMMVHRNIQAQIDHHERLGGFIANDVISPFGQTVVLNPPHSRRAVTLVSSDATVFVSDEHQLRSMADPQSPYTMLCVAALRRREDKHVIDAATASASVAAVTAGSGVITYTTQALPSALRFGTANTALSLTTIIAVNQSLSKSGVPNGQKAMFYAPGQLQDIMAITQASSSDFTRMRLHDKGSIDGESWEGFFWVEIPDLMDVDGTTSLQRMLNLEDANTRICLAMDRNAIGVSTGRDIRTVVNIRPDRNNVIQVRNDMAMGAVRVWEGGVRYVRAKEN